MLTRPKIPSLDDLWLFCAVARERSFTHVANDLGIPLATVSRRIASLERQLDAQLLRRSTRRVEPTDAGALLLSRAEAPLASLADALQCLGEESTTPRGRLRVTMPADMARHSLAAALASFAARHPDIRLELDLSSRLVDLLAEGYDLAIRVARPTDGSLIARPLFQMRTRLFASPGYLASLPPIRHPRDLDAVNALVITGRDSDRTWALARGRERASVVPHGNVEVNDLGALISLAAAGAGVALLPESAPGEQAGSGGLVPVLDSWYGPDAPVFAVYATRRMPLRLRLFLDHLRDASARPLRG